MRFASPRPRFKPQPRGFTLVELLVVISIIGVLVALLTPAIYFARLSAMNMRITTEIANMERGIDEYKNAFGDYPPNFDNPALLTRHLAKRQRLAGAQQTLFNSFAAGGSGTPIDAAEALVFWLGGQSPNGSLHNNPVVPLQTGAVGSRVGELKTFFEFDQGRYTDLDNDGWLEYSAPGTNGSPYVYFEARSYVPYFTNGHDVTSSGHGLAMPGVNTNPPTMQNHFINPTKFQILSAGLDGVFGPSPASSTTTFPNGPFETEERDNLSNFSAGKTFQDSVP